MCGVPVPFICISASVIRDGIICPVDLVLNKPPQEKKSDGVRSGDLAGHVMYGEPLPIHLAENCSS